VRSKKTNGFAITASHAVDCPRCNGTGKVEPEGISIGDRFRAARIRLNKTQAEVAPDLHITRAQLANVEADRSRPGIEMLVRAADVFGMSVDALLGRVS
jgi:DNA-binding XRE family transcriptional regulator